MTTLFLTVKDGTKIAYDTTGQGPALILLHGAGQKRSDWHKTGYVERLKCDFTVITIDIRGSGDSEILKDISDYTIEKICDDIIQVADACSAQRFFVWGYSFGGYVARYIGAWTTRALALVVIGAPLGPVIDDEFKKFVDEFLEKWRPLFNGFDSSQTTASPSHARKSGIKNRIQVWAACFQAMRTWPELVPNDLRCPTLLLTGTKNKSLWKWVQSNQTVLEAARVHVKTIEGFTHAQEFNEIGTIFPIVRAFFEHFSS